VDGASRAPRLEVLLVLGGQQLAAAICCWVGAGVVLLLGGGRRATAAGVQWPALCCWVGADGRQGEFRERSPAAADLLLGRGQRLARRIPGEIAGGRRSSVGSGAAAGEENSGSDRRAQLMIDSGRALGSNARGRSGPST
jgi:hypothetical protein